MLTHHQVAIYTARRSEMIDVVQAFLFYLNSSAPIPVHSPYSSLPYQVCCWVLMILFHWFIASQLTLFLFTLNFVFLPMYGVICTKTFVGFIFSVFFMKTCQGSTSLICCARLIKSSSRELVGSTLVMPRSTCHLNYCSLLSRTQFIGKDYYRPSTIYGPSTLQCSTNA